MQSSVSKCRERTYKWIIKILNVFSFIIFRLLYTLLNTRFINGNIISEFKYHFNTKLCFNTKTN